MKTYPLAVLVVLFLAQSGGSALGDTKSGPAKLKEGPEGAVTVKLGGEVKAECKFYVIPDFFGKRVVSVQASVKNTSTKMMYYGYYVAFFDDKKNLIGCSSFDSEIAKLAPGKTTNVGNVLQLPAAEIPKIASYQVTLLEDDKPFGK